MKTQNIYPDHSKGRFNALAMIYLAISFLSFICSSAVAQEQKGTWTSDMIVNPAAGKYYKDNRISVAADGVIWLARLEADAPDGPYKDYSLYKSADSGNTFTYVTGISTAATTKFLSADMIAVGSGSDARVVFAYSQLDTVSTQSSLFMAVLDGISFDYAILGETSFSYSSTRGWDKVVVCSDSKLTAAESAPYSLSLAAIKAGPNDSVVVWTNAGSLVPTYRSGLYGTPKYIRSLSIANGCNDPAISNYGKLGIAWDERPSSNDSFGMIKARFIYSDDATDYHTGYFVVGDSTVPSRNPSIAMSAVAIAGSGPGYDDIRTMIVYEKFVGTDPDIKFVVADSMFNGAPDLSHEQSVVASGSYEVMPYLSYDPVDANFNLTYYTASSNKLVYDTRALGAVYTSAFTVVKSNYRDATSAMNFQAVAPRLDLGPDGKAYFVWNDLGTTMIDAESAPLAISNVVAVNDLSVFPNPVHDVINLSFTGTAGGAYTLELSDLTGKVVARNNEMAQPGRNLASMPLPELSTGIYILKLEGKGISAAIRVSVAE